MKAPGGRTIPAVDQARYDVALDIPAAQFSLPGQPEVLDPKKLTAEAVAQRANETRRFSTESFFGPPFEILHWLHMRDYSAFLVIVRATLHRRQSSYDLRVQDGPFSPHDGRRLDPETVNRLTQRIFIESTPPDEHWPKDVGAHPPTSP
jgi:hypothetical protein